MDELFRRCEANPLLTADDVPVAASAAYNPGAIETPDGVVLLLRVEDEKGFSSIHVARSRDGVSDWDISPKPLLEYGLPDMRYEELGCEDARVTYLEDRGAYYLTYVAYSPVGPAVGLARTEDFCMAERIGLIFAPNNKDTVMFPEKVGDYYMVLHRPVAGNIENIWSARSPDLTHWGMPHCVVPERGGPWWDGTRVGAGAPPIRTEAGWLLIYHGVKMFGQSMVYRAGLALLDLEQPHKVIARAPGWAFGPSAEYERRGFMPNTVFPSGCIRRGDEIWMYYGAADTCVGLAVAPLKALLDVLREEP